MGIYEIEQEGNEAMKKILCIAAVIAVSAAAGLGGGYLSEHSGQKEEQVETEAPVLPELIKTDEQAGYQVPEHTEAETQPVKKEGEWLQQDDGGYAYVNAEGNYLSGGWEEIDDAWYCFDNNGKMVTGWTKKDGVYYYLDTDGRMRTGWIKDSANGLWYYLNEDGSLLTSSTTPDGYDVNSSGALYYRE